MTASAGWAQQVPGADVRSGRSLKDVPTQLRPAAAAPATRLSPVNAQGTLGASSRQTSLQGAAPATSLGTAAQPQTALLLRQAEVPPQRLAITRSLLAELHARQTAQQAISIDLPADVLFDFDKADLRPDALPTLQKAAELIQSYPRAPLRVVGHTDSKGSDGYNDTLSQRRSQAVAHALQERTGRSVAARGRGKREPVAANTTPDGQDDPAGRQRNRRVQILIEPPAGGVPS
jgi:outer membrane protein OmpA-like peptidoglycan-associated protein